MATLASGNWYVEPGIWFDSAIASTSDNFWECVTRGMPLRMAQLLCKSFLDRLMIVRPTRDEGPEVLVKKLEWWRFAAKGDHPLWRGSGAGSEDAPSIPSKPEPRGCWPDLATVAWMRRVRHILGQLRESRVEEYRAYLQRESIGASAHHHRQRALRDECRKIWPERAGDSVEIITRVMEPVVSWKTLVTYARSSDAQRRPVTEEEQVARMGIDAYLYNLCGKEVDLIAMLSNEDRGRFQSLAVKRKIREGVELCDSSIRSWAAGLNCEIEALHVVPGLKRRSSRKIVVCFIPNAGGKGWLCQYSSALVDMDVAVYKYVGWRRRRKLVDDGLHDWCREAVAAIKMFDDNESKMILTQWPCSVFVKAGQLLSRDVEFRKYVIQRSTREKRMLDRGMERAKVDEYLAIAEKNESEYDTIGVRKEYSNGEEILHDIHGW